VRDTSGAGEASVLSSGASILPSTRTVAEVPTGELLQLLSSAALELDGVVIAVQHVLIETDHQYVLDRRHAMLVLHPLRHFDPEHGALGYARRAVLGRLEAFAAEGRLPLKVSSL